jgi:hypothetical protein
MRIRVRFAARHTLRFEGQVCTSSPQIGLIMNQLTISTGLQAGQGFREWP